MVLPSWPENETKWSNLAEYPFHLCLMDFNAFSFLFNPIKRLLATLVVFGGKNAS